MTTSAGSAVANPRLRRLLGVLVGATAALVVLLYLDGALALVAYRWDWSPDEGLYLDQARRLLRSPASLYPAGVVPMPAGYGPGLPLLLAPVVALFDNPLPPARLLACGWTALIVVAAYRLIRRRTPALLASIAASLLLAPFYMSLWYMLVRPDGPMLAFWLWAAVLLLPEQLEAGADRLTLARTLGGAALLLAATLTKPTALLCGAPLVVGWGLVDRRSAQLLVSVMLAGGLTLLGLLQVVTDGRFLRVMGWYRSRDELPGLLLGNLWFFVQALAPILGFLMAVLLLALWSRRRPFRDSALLLVAGGLALVPVLSKFGAMPNHLLPLLCGIVILAGRWCGTGGNGSRPWIADPLVPGLAAALAAAAMLQAHGYLPRPSRVAAATAAAFYHAVEARVRERGKPILVLRPEYAYFVADQPVEAEGSGFHFLLRARAPGTGQVLSGVEAGRYRSVIVTPAVLPAQEELARAIERHYRVIGGCQLSYFYGPASVLILVPRGEAARFEPPPGVRCFAEP
jgi:4-amino-4-deoxy-L-arabinose transferase-like glycosyltransferase